VQEVRTLHDVPPHVVAAEIARAILTTTTVELPRHVWDALGLLSYLPSTTATVRDLGSLDRRPWTAAELYSDVLHGLDEWTGTRAEHYKVEIGTYLMRAPLLGRYAPITDRRRITIPSADPSVMQPRCCDGEFLDRAARNRVHPQLGSLDERFLRVWLPKIAHGRGCTHPVVLRWTTSGDTPQGFPLSTWTVESRFGTRRPVVSVAKPGKRS
jgi:hypothetical protein